MQQDIPVPQKCIQTKKDNEMKWISMTRHSTLVLLGCLAILSISWMPAPVNTYDSVVVVKVQNLSSEQFNQVAAFIGGNNQLNIDYYCLWSGVMVLKLTNSNLHEAGDIHLFTKRTLNEASSLDGVEILHVHTSISGIAKC